MMRPPPPPVGPVIVIPLLPFKSTELVAEKDAPPLKVMPPIAHQLHVGLPVATLRVGEADDEAPSKIIFDELDPAKANAFVIV
jgi:hypothetical protein